MTTIASMPVGEWRKVWTEIGHDIAESGSPRMIPACLAVRYAEHSALKHLPLFGWLYEISEREMSIFENHPPEVAAMCAYLLAAMTPQEFLEICGDDERKKP